MYHNQPFHRGHLVPARTMSIDRSHYKSTYKYTNAVPQLRPFNQGSWSRYEMRIRRYARNTCTSQAHRNGVLYLLTGPSFVQLHHANPVGFGLGPAIQRLGGNNPGIVIPHSMWTAGCCVGDNGIESFAVIGGNLPHIASNTQQITVQQLQEILSADVTHRNFGGPNVNLFPGNVNCANNNNNLAHLPQAVQGDWNKAKTLKQKLAVFRNQLTDFRWGLWN